MSLKTGSSDRRIHLSLLNHVAHGEMIRLPSSRGITPNHPYLVFRQTKDFGSLDTYLAYDSQIYEHGYKIVVGNVGAFTLRGASVLTIKGQSIAGQDLNMWRILPRPAVV